MKKILFTLLSFFIGSLAIYGQQLKVASYNIRNANPNDSLKGNGWQQRCPVISQLVLFNDFDIIGMQEVLERQRLDLIKSLPQYEHAGIGRDDAKTKGEYSSIFYKKDKFDLIKSGNFWLSENPDYPNIGWDAGYIRICSWVKLRDKISDKKVWFFNVHMDHRGIKARREGAKLILAKIRQLCGNDPVILVGDFNVTQKNEVYNLLANSEILSDSYQIAKVRYALNGTFSGFDPNGRNEDRIDHVFVTPSLSVERYGILTDTYRTEVEDSSASEKKFVARVPSDHFPVSVVLNYIK